MSGNLRNRHVFDSNRYVTEGMIVNAWFTRKFEDKFCIEARFKIGKLRCTGVLHVSQFPAQTRAERDAMFQIAKAPSGRYRLRVIQVIAPEHPRRLSSVRLSARLL